jgi:hypothetical protein
MVKPVSLPTVDFSQQKNNVLHHIYSTALRDILTVKL